MPNFYAVRRGRRTGVFTTWDECKVHVERFSGAEYKKFKKLVDAQNFVNNVKPLSTAFPKVIPSAPLSGLRAPLAPISAQSNSLAGIQNAQSFATAPPNGNIPPPGASTGQAPPPIPSVGVKRKYVKRAVRKPASTVKAATSEGEAPAKASLSAVRKAAARKRRRSLYKVMEQYMVSKEGYTVCYTDGACVANGRRKAKAGIGVYWGAGDPRNVSERLTGLQTNNRAEIEACCRAIEQAKSSGVEKLEIRTDSTYVINCVTKWIHQWRRNNWVSAFGRPVKNKPDLLRLVTLSESMDVHWMHVAGHSGISGNEEADKLAREGINK